MKKYRTDKSKLILAALTIPMIVSVLPVENVFAAENEIPSLHVYELNGNPKLEWATEILKENILTMISYEDNKLPGLKNNNKYDSLHGISSEAAYSGNYGYLLNDNSNNKGNYFNFPATSSSKHLSNYGTFYFENGIPLSMTFKAKSVGTSTIVPWGNGGYANSITSLKNKLVKPYTAGQTIMYLDSLDGLGVGSEITSDTDPNKIENTRKIVAIDEKNKTITLGSSFPVSMNTGDNLKQRPWRYAFSFNSRKMTNTDWETYSINTYVTNNADYDIATRGAILYLNTETNGKLMIDDLTFGYATEVEVFRDGKSIYKGYLSDFHDKSAKDNAKPNKVQTVKGQLNNDLTKLSLAITKPTDTGSTTSYTIQAIAKNGTRSAMSAPQNITLTSGVTKYKYEISNNPNVSSLNKETTSNQLDFNLNTVNLQKDYIHIQTVDGAGNVSAIQTFKLADIVDVSSLDALYDKLKQVESKGNYEEFLTFMDEVESLYGVNIPGDIKDRIQDLAAYHGENTAFLELLEGDFSLTTKDITSFGKVKLTAEKQILKTNFADEFKVIDARGTQQGWKVNVSATPFIEDTFSGFVGTPTQLPIGTLAINTVQDIKQVGLVHESKLPTPFTNDFAIIDSGEVTVLNANKGHGMGEFTFNFGEDSLSMVVDSTTAKIDNVNYPEGVTPYTSTITWNLITGP